MNNVILRLGLLIDAVAFEVLNDVIVKSGILFSPCAGPQTPPTPKTDKSRLLLPDDQNKEHPSLGVTALPTTLPVPITTLAKSQEPEYAKEKPATPKPLLHVLRGGHDRSPLREETQLKQHINERLTVAGRDDELADHVLNAIIKEVETSSQDQTTASPGALATPEQTLSSTTSNKPVLPTTSDFVYVSGLKLPPDTHPLRTADVPILKVPYDAIAYGSFMDSLGIDVLSIQVRSSFTFKSGYLFQLTILDISFFPMTVDNGPRRSL
jgi:hypothetical protein